jgi:hypothetical protein
VRRAILHGSRPENYPVAAFTVVGQFEYPQSRFSISACGIMCS